jgi:hypothetical protein
MYFSIFVLYYRSREKNKCPIDEEENKMKGFTSARKAICKNGVTNVEEYFPDKKGLCIWWNDVKHSTHLSFVNSVSVVSVVDNRAIRIKYLF